jgi:hypothetical protein
MSIRKLDRNEWAPYCVRVSRVVLGKWAEIEVASLEIGFQIEARQRPLLGISYDPKKDMLDIALDGLDHMIPRPQEMYVEEDIDGLVSFEVLGGDGVQRIVILHQPLMLPPPEADLRY